MSNNLRQAAQAALEPVTVEAVAEVIETEDGLDLSWLIEGGICDLPAGVVLMVSDKPITGDDGSGEVFTAPQAQQPLTREQIDAVWSAQGSFTDRESDYRCFARAIERAHGIGEKP